MVESLRAGEEEFKVFSERTRILIELQTKNTEQVDDVRGLAQYLIVLLSLVC